MLGLRFQRAEIERLIRGLRTMIMGIRGIENSSYFQEIFAYGQAEGHAQGRVEGKVEGQVRKVEGRSKGRSKGRSRER